MVGTKDFMVNMDYLALAMFQNVRDDLLESTQQIESLQIFMTAEVMTKAYPLITIAERIKKVMLDIQEKKLLSKIKASKTGNIAKTTSGSKANAEMMVMTSVEAEQ